MNRGSLLLVMNRSSIQEFLSQGATYMTDTWNPSQYNVFAAERAQPFWDLADLVDTSTPISNAVDLGCGTGELTADLHRKLKARSTLGIDRSAAMLEKAHLLEKDGLSFRQSDIGSFAPNEKYDLVFSNASLQWLPDHETLFPKLLSLVKPAGQFAAQIPANFDHVAHRAAQEVSRALFGEEFDGMPYWRYVLPLERYAELIYKTGFKHVKCRMQVYLHPMESGERVLEWTKGTLLTSIQSKLTPDQFARFVDEYRARLLKEIGTGPYLFTFKRLLLWARH